MGSCSRSKAVAADAVTRTLIATVVDQKGVLVGEYDDGSKIMEKNTDERIITWDGFSLTLKADDGNMYQFLSKDLFYEGDRVLVKVQNGTVQSVKFSP